MEGREGKEGWKKGRMEGWKVVVGRMEGWKDGREEVFHVSRFTFHASFSLIFQKEEFSECASLMKKRSAMSEKF